MAEYNKLLAQSRPSTTNATAVYNTSKTGMVTEVYSIWICNTSGADATFRAFFNNNGTTYDQTTALFWDTPIYAGSSIFIEAANQPIATLSTTTARLAVRSSVANALTFTISGRER